MSSIRLSADPGPQPTAAYLRRSAALIRAERLGVLVLGRVYTRAKILQVAGYKKGSGYFIFFQCDLAIWRHPFKFRQLSGGRGNNCRYRFELRNAA